MSGTTKFAVGCLILWVACIIGAKLYAPAENVFFNMTLEEQNHTKLVLLALQSASKVAFLGAILAGILSLLLYRERKYQEKYMAAQEQAKANAAFALSSENVTALNQIVAHIQQSDLATEDKRQASTLFSSIQNAQENDQANGEQIKSELEAIVKLAENVALQGDAANALANLKSLTG